MILANVMPMVLLKALSAMKKANANAKLDTLDKNAKSAPILSPKGKVENAKVCIFPNY